MEVDEFLKTASTISIDEIKRISDEAVKENKIPKIVHFCFFNWENLTTNEKEYIPLLQSWIDVLVPQGYTFVNWTRDKLPDIHYLNLALSKRLWAFGADYARIYALYNYGGFYMDCDVAVYKSFDDLLDLPYVLDCEYSMFVSTDKRQRIEAGMFGCRKGWNFLKPVLDFFVSYNINTMNTLQLCLPFLINTVTRYAGFTIDFAYGDIEKYREFVLTSTNPCRVITLDSTYFSKTEMDLPHVAINIVNVGVISHHDEHAYTSHQLFDKWCS